MKKKGKLLRVLKGAALAGAVFAAGVFSNTGSHKQTGNESKEGRRVVSVDQVNGAKDNGNSYVMVDNLTTAKEHLGNEHPGSDANIDAFLKEMKEFENSHAAEWDRVQRNLDAAVKMEKEKTDRAFAELGISLKTPNDTQDIDSHLVKENGNSFGEIDKTMSEDQLTSNNIHADWRGQFKAAKDSGKIDDANFISRNQGWQIPIPENSELWQLNINDPNWQKAYNGLRAQTRSFFNGYLDMISEGLSDIEAMNSPSSAHKNTADVYALFQARYLYQMDRVLSNFSVDKIAKNLSAEQKEILQTYQLFQMANQHVLGPALDLCHMEGYGLDAITAIRDGVEQLKTPSTAEKILQTLNSTPQKFAHKKILRSHGRDSIGRF